MERSNIFPFSMHTYGLKPSTVGSKVPFIGDILYEKKQLLKALTETLLHSHKDGKLQIKG